MTHHVIVRTRYDTDAVAVRVVRQRAGGDDPFRSGTYSLAVGVHEVVWVSTSQKMTRTMAMNLSEYTGACQQEGGQAKSLPVLGLRITAPHHNTCCAALRSPPHL